MNPLDNLDEKLKGYVLSLESTPIDVYNLSSTTKRSEAIRNVSEFFYAKEYEQVLPSFCTELHLEARVPTHIIERSIAVCIGEEFFETLPDLHICKYCGKIEQYPDDERPCANCGRLGLSRLTPKTFPEPWYPYPFPRKIDPWTDIYLQVEEILRQTIYYDKEIYYKIHALWIIATYLVNLFDTVPYLQFIGPVQSGKTKALEVTALLSYRGVLLSSVSPAALCRMIDHYKITPCVDQAERIFDQKRDYGIENYNIWTSGYRRNQYYVRASQENTEEVELKRVFGFKALASTRTFDEAIAGRSIIIKMKEGYPAVDNPKFLMEDIQRVRMQLLYMRLFAKGMIDSHIYKINDYDIKGRLKEIYLPIIAVADFFQLDLDDLVKFIEKDGIEKLRELQESLEGRIVAAIKEIIDEDIGQEALSGEKVWIPIKDIAEKVDEHPRKVGLKLKVLDIRRTRTREGVVIDLALKENQEQLKYLFRKYGLSSGLDYL
ncbi:MAG: hypothetical protein DRJ03_23775 [Chloroflexi bacterium]|nr:MAG: hypothetical protein DRJ03_23775 [Chloroflexota bacterium]